MTRQQFLCYHVARKGFDMENRYDKFTKLITNINRNIQKIKKVVMEQLGLKGNQVQVMFHLYKQKKEGISLTKLASICDEDKAAISRTIKELESKGFVFVEENIDQKYRNPIKLTEKGLKVGEIVSQKIDEFFNLGRDGVLPSDIDRFYFLLNLISDNLQNIYDSLEKDDK